METEITTDTPQNACPHCGAKQSPHIKAIDEYECETLISKGGVNTKRSALCRERERHHHALLRARKAEAEVERLTNALDQMTRDALATARDRDEWMTRALVAGSKEGK